MSMRGQQREEEALLDTSLKDTKARIKELEGQIQGLRDTIQGIADTTPEGNVEGLTTGSAVRQVCETIVGWIDKGEL